MDRNLKLRQAIDDAERCLALLKKARHLNYLGQVNDNSVAGHDPPPADPLMPLLINARGYAGNVQNYIHELMEE